MKILLILDIDETFLHLVTGKHVIPSDYNYDSVKIDGTSTIYYRPGFEDFLQFAKDNREWLTLGIWTAGNKLYADMNHRFLLQRFNLPEDMFLLVYSETEIKKDLKNGLFDKDLRRVFMTHPEFSHENTFLVDNLPSNLYHMANRENSILVEWFVPTNIYYNPWHDYVFDDLQQICSALRDAEPSHTVFHKTQIENTGLKKYHHHFLIGGEKKQMMALGTIDETDYFRIFRVKTSKGGRTSKINRRWQQTRIRSKLRYHKLRKNIVIGNGKHGNNTVSKL